jgi:hypothetical protein
VAPSTYHPPTSTEHSPQNFTTPPQYGVTLDELTCSICRNVLDQPIELTKCGSVVCASCISRWLLECDESLPCPCCHRTLYNTEDIRRAQAVIQQLLGGLQVSCTCGETVSNELHMKGENDTDGNLPEVASIHEIIAQPINVLPLDSD